MKHARPWYRKQTDSWYICHRGKQVPLSKGKKNRKEAEKLAHAILAGTDPAQLPQFVRVGDVMLRWFEYCDKHCDSARWYHDLLDSFHAKFAIVRIADLKPSHVLEWLKEKDWSDTSINKAIGALQTAINYAVKLQIIPENPIKGMRKPTAAKRVRILRPEERPLVFGKIIGKGFRDFLMALDESGARPGELARVTSEDIHFAEGVIILWKHKSGKKTGRPRVIYMTPVLQETCRQLIAKVPVGTPIFRTIRGRPFSKDSLNCRFRRLRGKHPRLKGVTAYSLRHSYATEALVRGVPSEALRVLIGHSASSRVLEEVYSHVDQKADYLKDMAQKAKANA